MTERIAAVGDVHGQSALLDAALARIEADAAAHGPAEVVMLGDYVDRGPDTRGTIERLMAWHDPGAGRHAILGNHDRMFAWFLEDAPRDDPHLFDGLDWLHPRLGGRTTLASYGVDADEGRDRAAIHADARRAVPAAHLDWVRALPLTVERAIGGRAHLFVHAGIRPGVPIADQAEEDLLWIREGFLDHPDDLPALVVHGHTVVETPQHRGNRVALDTGAGYGRALTAAMFEPGGAFVLGGAGRRPLAPARTLWDWVRRR